MRRDSAKAKRLVLILQEAGIDVDGRRLEAWARERVTPPPDLAEEDWVEHLRELTHVLGKGSGSGRLSGYDRAALLLAARGFATERYRQALGRSLRAPSLPDPQQSDPPPSGGHAIDTDAGAAAVYRVGRELADFGRLDDVIPPHLRPLSRILRSVTQAAAPLLDSATGTLERPAGVATAIFELLASVGVGNKMHSELDVLAAATGQRYQTDAELDNDHRISEGARTRLKPLEVADRGLLQLLVERLGGGLFLRAAQAAVDASLYDLVAAAVVVRSFVLLPGTAGMSEDELDLIAAQGAPTALVLIEDLLAGLPYRERSAIRRTLLGSDAADSESPDSN